MGERQLFHPHLLNGLESIMIVEQSMSCQSLPIDRGKDKDFFSIGVELPLKNSPSTMVRIVERQEQLDSFLAEFP